MIAVLLAPAIVAPGGLEVAVRRGANPDVIIGRRNGETVEPQNARLVADLFPRGIEIDELFAATCLRV